jgi:hypothetical protein
MVGKRGRSAFLVDLIRDEIQRLSQQSALTAAAGAWKDENHPELKRGATAWVQRMRNESNRRFQSIQNRQKKG